MNSSTFYVAICSWKWGKLANFYCMWQICLLKAGVLAFMWQIIAVTYKKLTRVDGSSHKMWQICSLAPYFSGPTKLPRILLCISAVQDHYWRTKFRTVDKYLFCHLHITLKCEQITSSSYEELLNKANLTSLRNHIQTPRYCYLNV